MKKIWFGFAALLLGSSIIYGYETDVQNEIGTAVATENTVSLTPKRGNAPVIRAQEPPRPNVSQVSAAVPITEVPPAPAIPAAIPPAPTYHYEAPRIAMATPSPAPTATSATGETDPFVYVELERLAGEVQKLQKDTAKPNTKKAFSTPKLSGIAFFDFYSIDQPNGSSLNYQNQSGIRELRLGVSGNGYDSFDYKAEIGVNQATTGGINVYDTWIGAKNVPLFGYLRAGHYRVETGLGAMTGSTQTTLQEYTAPAATFAISRRLGVSSEHLFANDRIRLFYGLFQGQAINNNAHYVRQDDQGPIFNTRLTIAPYFAEKGRYVLHVGGHYSYVDQKTAITYRPLNNSWLFSGTVPKDTTAPISLNPVTLDTGTIASNHHHRGGLELAYQSGPFAARSEAFFARYGAADNDRTATGASLELTYFLTGEHRDYNLATGTFGAATVRRPFHPFKSGDWNLVDGMGAWQFVTQYAYVDLEDWRGLAGTYANRDRGGRQHDLTFGLNWFWTSNIRWIFSYTHSQQNVGSDHHYDYQDILGTSLRVYF